MRKKLCIRCGTKKKVSAFCKKPDRPDGLRVYCKECDNSLNRLRYYERTKGRKRRSRLGPSDKYRRKYPEKYKAHCVVNNALRDGKLKRQGCRICGSKAQAHHHDYNKPLDVTWLCSKHHAEEHLWGNF